MAISIRLPIYFNGLLDFSHDIYLFELANYQFLQRIQRTITR